jgi:hypothetical protein
MTWRVRSLLASYCSGWQVVLGYLLRDLPCFNTSYRVFCGAELMLGL